MTLNFNTSKKTCIYCLKKYTNKTSLDKHTIICCFYYKSKRQIKIEEEESQDIPTYKELCIIINELFIKVKKLNPRKKLIKPYASSN